MGGGGARPRGGGTASTLRTGYLVLYNCISAAGWALILLVMGRSLAHSGHTPHAVENATPLVVGMQLLATLELLHVLTGLTKGGALPTFLQIWGRDFALFLTAAAEPAVRRTPWAALLYVSWALSEVIRYPYYAAHLLDACPSALHWLRYSAFLVLYPLGFIAEAACFILTLPIIQKENKYAIPHLPEGAQVWLLGAYMLIAFGWAAPSLYRYMLSARRKQLRVPIVTGTAAKAD